MKLDVAIPPELRGLAWRVQGPEVLALAWDALPAVTETLTTDEGWSVSLAPDPRDGSLFAIYEIGPFVAAVQVGPVTEATFAGVLETLLAATVLLAPRAPVALADLVRATTTA